MATIFKPYVFLVLVATFFLIVSFFVSKETLEVNLIDAYYIISFTQFLKILSVVFFVFSAFYKLLNRYLTLLTLSYLHIVTMVVTIGIFIFITDPFGKILNWTTLIFCLSQLLFLTNICYGILKKPLNNRKP